MIEIPISPGELIDKITILEIKQGHLRNPEKLNNVLKELEVLQTILSEEVQSLPELEAMTQKLKEINETLWEIEDAIRACEQRADFGDGFIRLARLVYRRNDERSAVKRSINQLLDSEIVEEKSYTPY
jgi:hypothetical protein